MALEDAFQFAFLEFYGREIMLVVAPLLAILFAQGPVLGGTPVHPTRLLVKVSAGASESTRLEAFASVGATEVRFLPEISWSVVEVTPGARDEARLLLESHAALPIVSFDRSRRTAYVPNDPLWSGMWHMTTIRADQAWNTTKGDPSIRIALIDTGAEEMHPDLAANVWTNPGETAGNSIDDDGNGYVDDVNGYDFAYNDSSPDDVYGHGTSCAGIAAAIQDNGLGATGIAPDCEFAILKAGDDSGLFYDSAIVPALLYCANMGFQIATMSFASDLVTPAERDAIDYCWANGVLAIAAAGNSSSVLPIYPAAYDNTLSVGATLDASDARAFFTNFGSSVGVAAPGFGLRTTVTGGGFTSSFSGTSGACPHVAGLAGLLLAANPSATNADVRGAIEDTALLLTAPGYGYWSSYGRIDASDALDRILGVTSGSVPARAAFVAPCGGMSKLRNGKTSNTHLTPAPKLSELALYGVGLESPNIVTATASGSPLVLDEQSRQRATFALDGLPDQPTIDFECNGSVFESIEFERAGGWLFAATDAGTKLGGIALGGFSELYRNDGQLFSCTRNSSSEVFAEFVVRGIPDFDFDSMLVQFTRGYTDCNGATETLEVYDWSSGSHPQGNWVTLLTHAVGPSTSMRGVVAKAPGSATRYIDDAGVVYLRLATGTTGSSGKVEIDRLRLLLR